MNTVQELIEAIRQGEMIVLLDDEDRENEGDVVMAAEKVTAQHINFMARYARGLICLPLSQAHCERLELPLMVQENNARFKTNFTLSIEAKEGVTTGISAHDRAHTILTAVSPAVQPSDLVQPGHIFPIMAQPGGVLVRAGHTEATVDLARLAGLQSAAVICEVLNDDGTMARRDQLAAFAKTHDLKIGTIADLIRYRLEKEPTLSILSRVPYPADPDVFDLVAFQDHMTHQTHYALVKGSPDLDEPVWARVHVNHALWHLRADKKQPANTYWDLEAAMAWISAQEAGVIVLLEPPQLPAVQTAQQLSDWAAGATQSETVSSLIGVGSQILSLLKYGKIKVLGNQKAYFGLSGFGLEVVEYLSYVDALKQMPALKIERSTLSDCSQPEIA